MTERGQNTEPVHSTTWTEYSQTAFYSEIKFAEYVCANNEFPLLRKAGFLEATEFKHPEYLNRKCYFMKTGFLEPKKPVCKKVKEELEQFNKLLIEAKDRGCEYIILHALSDWKEYDPIIKELIRRYICCPPDWYPGRRDGWHDGSGSYYTEHYIKSTPIFRWLLEETKGYRPPIRWESVLRYIEKWVDTRAAEKDKIERVKTQKLAAEKAEQQRLKNLEKHQIWRLRHEACDRCHGNRDVICICGPEPCKHCGLDKAKNLYEHGCDICLKNEEK
jgi:hypothetical protein